MNKKLSTRQHWAIARLTFWHLDRNRWQEAEQLARGLLALDQRDGLAWMYYGEARRNQDDTLEATRAFGQAAKLLKNRPDVWMRLGDCLIRQNQRADARQALEMARSLLKEESGLRQRVEALLRRC